MLRFMGRACTTGWGLGAGLFVLTPALLACPAEAPPEVLGSEEPVVAVLAEEARHVTLTANAAAVREANRGVHVEIRAPFGRDDVILDVVPDRTELDELAVRHLPVSRGFPASASVIGGDLRDLCPDTLETGLDCQLGFTLVVVTASAPLDLAATLGLARQGVAGVYGCGSEPREFSAAARVDVVFD